MPKTPVALTRMRSICLSFPDTKETPTWGTPHFRVGEKIFAGYGDEKGKASIGFKLEMAHAKAILRDKRFQPAPYVGHKGWVSMDVGGPVDWDQVREWIEESYELIAPKKSLAKMSPGGTALVATKKKKKKKSTTTSARRRAAR